jgi:hypothetical protein
MSTASNWLLNLIIAVITPYLVDAIAVNVFFLWGGFCVVCFFFVFFMVPETVRIDSLCGCCTDHADSAFETEGTLVGASRSSLPQLLDPQVKQLSQEDS